MLSRNRKFLEDVVKVACAEHAARPRVFFPNPAIVADTPLWTDDYSNLFRILALDANFRDLGAGGNFCNAQRAG